MKPLLPLLGCSFLFVALSFAADQSSLPPKEATDAITAADLLKHIKVLASDEFEGRAPGSKGEELSVKYISEQFKALGLKPGNPNGSYTQEVPLAGITSAPTASFTVGGKTMELKFPDDYVASSARLQEEVKAENTDVVFVGYGVVAPEYGWDDYKDVDVRGKTILMLINDPAIPDPADPSKLDEKMFKGRAMTYYGRWTYKYEIAAQKGAARRGDHPRDGTSRVSLFRRHDELGQGEFRDRRAEQEHGRGPDPVMDHARCREKVACGQRPGF